MANKNIIFKEIFTPRLVLRKITEKDKDVMFRIFSEYEIVKWAGCKVLKSKDETIEHINGYEKRYKEGTQIAWGIELKKEKKMIGFIALSYIDKTHAFAYLGSSLLPEYSGQGITTEANIGVINFAFNETFLNRIESQFYEKHKAMERVNIKSGMTREALIRENFMIEGKYRNSIMYSIIKNDFLKNKDFFNFSKK